jgi:hypothetical protein
MKGNNTQFRMGPGMVICLLLAPLVLAQTSSIRVDGNVIKGYITKMAAPEYMGRKSLTPGYEKIADWAAGMFKEWGLQPAGDKGTYFQSVPIKGDRSSFVWTTGVPELTIELRTFYVKDNDFTVDVNSTPGTKVSGEVVFVGYGISAPAKGLDEYTMDVKGKIVLAFKGSPKDAPRAGGMGLGPPPQAPPAEKEKETEAWTEESGDMYKAKVGYDKGAAAILLYNPPVTPAPAGPAAGPPAGPPARREVTPSPFTRPFVYVSNVDERVFRWIMSRDPQETVRGFGVRIDQMRRDIKNKKARSMSTGVKAQVKGFDTATLYGEKFNNNISRNVLAKIEGTDPELKNQYVIIGGHLDHLGITNGVVYNGADDNASGSAVTMEVARLLALHKIQPKRTIIFGLWCGEELGLLGSRYYVSTPSDGVSMDRTAAYFNMDMVGLGTEIGAPGALNFPEVFDLIMRDQDPEIAKMVRARPGGPGGSDHSGFIELGIEALALMTSGGGGHPDYHDASDDADKMEPEILGKTGQFVLQGVLNLANETKVNLLIAERQHLYNAMRMTIPNITGGGSGWDFVKASSNAELLSLANNRARELKRPRPAVTTGMRFVGQAGPRVNLGVRDASVFEGNVPLLETAYTLLDFGRVDVVRDDGSWFNGGVTPKGREAVKAMEANNIAINLVNPSAKLLGDMLEVATKPFMVTLSGTNTVDAALAGRMNEKNDLMAIECNPADVQGCVVRLENAKTLFGDVDNLVLSINATGNIDEAKKSLYMALVKNGWTRDQIYAMTGAGGGEGRGGGGRPGGNLARLTPGRGEDR